MRRNFRIRVISRATVRAAAIPWSRRRVVLLPAAGGTDSGDSGGSAPWMNGSDTGLGSVPACCGIAPPAAPSAPAEPDAIPVTAGPVSNGGGAVGLGMGVAVGGAAVGVGVKVGKGVAVGVGIGVEVGGGSTELPFAPAAPGAPWWPLAPLA